MNIENFSLEKLESPSKLDLLAQEMPNKCMDITELDRPLWITQATRDEMPPVSGETRERMKGEKYSDAVMEAIGSEAEAKIYEAANLEPAVINGKDALIRTDIDYDKKDIFDNTNLERMKEGKAPLDANDKPIELHHIGQNQDSPLAELTVAEHRGKGNDNILHNKLKESEIDREEFGKERADYWKARAEQIENQH
jgi:hypothetical protein